MSTLRFIVLCGGSGEGRAGEQGDPAGVAGGSMWKNTRYSGNRAIS
jgi:hypothetical protein